MRGIFEKCGGGGGTTIVPPLRLGLDYIRYGNMSTAGAEKAVLESKCLEGS